MVGGKGRPLKVFLCHASGDKPPVRDLYKRLTNEGVDAWLDKEKLLPGQDWRREIPKAVQEADVVVVCLSNKSVTKEGYVQKEIKFALDSAEEKPEGAIFLIPARLEDCLVPERLSRWQWVDLYEQTGFVQLLRSLKLRADAVGATVEPTSYADSDKEAERRLEQLYTEGLAAFYTEDWEKACHRFQSILSGQPNHRNAAEKLAEAERQWNLSKLYEQAAAAVRSEDWQGAIKLLEELTQRSAEYKDAASLLRNARKQKQLKALYAEASRLHAAQKWQAVVKVFEQISVIEPNFPDVDGLLPSAQKEVAEIKRQDELNSLYARALREMDAGKWYEARRLLEQVHKSQTGFMETERLLKKVEGEISREEEKRKQNDQVNTLYEQAHGLLRSKKWRNALEKMEEIRKLEEHFPDADGIAEKAQKGLAGEEQEAERQNKLAALYAEAVRLLKEEKYQEALDQWGEVKALDPKYPDRQWVVRTAKKKLGVSVRHSPIIQPKLSIQNIEVGWLILLAALGFGLARFVELNLAGVFRVDLPAELTWGMTGALQGLIAALVLARMEKEWKWKSLPIFGVCWAVVYPVALWTFRKEAASLISSMVFSLAPAISIVLSSVWTRRVKQWQMYAFISLGWILAWVIGFGVADYINPVLHGSSLRWVFRDVVAGAIGLWITVDLLKPGLAEKLSGTAFKNERKPSDPARLLLVVFPSIVTIRAIWGFLRDWLNIWQAEFPSFTQILFYIVLGGCYGAVVAYALKKTVPNWSVRQSLVVIMGWVVGLTVALLARLVNMEFIAVVIAFCGLSVVAAIAWAVPSMAPIKLTLIFLCWAVSWNYGQELGEFLSNPTADYAWLYVDAVTIVLGLLGTLAILEYFSVRLIRLSLLLAFGMALGNYVGAALARWLSASVLIENSFHYALFGLIGGAVFEAPSRDWKKILFRGGVCAVALAIAGAVQLLIFKGELATLRSPISGLLFGLAFGLFTRKISIVALLSLVSPAIFTAAQLYVTRQYVPFLQAAIIRGALIGLVIGFAYAYLTREEEKHEVTG